jgi:hypothetical protein
MGSIPNSTLVAEINLYISRNGGNLKVWTIGITDDPARRLKEHQADGAVVSWKPWPTESELAARHIEQVFINCGAKGGGGGNTTGKFVYVFR